MADEDDVNVFASLLDRHLREGTAPEGRGKVWQNKSFAQALHRYRDVTERMISNWRRGVNLPNDITAIEKVLFGDSEANSARVEEFRDAFAKSRRARARVRTSDTPEEITALYTPRSLDDLLKLGLSKIDVEQFLQTEKKNHPELFGARFVSMPLVMGIVIIVADWNLEVIKVDRIVQRSEAYPLTTAWTNALSQYRRTYSLQYRKSNSAHEKYNHKTIMTQYTKLVQAMIRYNSILGEHGNSGYEVELLNNIYEEAEFYAYNEMYDKFIAAVESVLSISHKFLMEFIPIITTTSPGVRANIEPDKIQTYSVSDPSKGVILLVEDDNDLFRFMTGAIKSDFAKGNYEIICAKNGAEALRAIANKEVVLLITDILMPLLDGIQLGKIIRDTNPNSKILVVSGYASAVMIQKELVVDKILSKPFHLAQLLKHVRQLLLR